MMWSRTTLLSILVSGGDLDLGGVPALNAVVVAGLSTEAPAPQCWCFDLCSSSNANAYWAASRGVRVHNRSSPWLRYFAAVYSDAQVPIPFPLHRVNYFYHGVRQWYGLFSAVHNPFRPCDLPAPSERSSVPPCAQSVCAAWHAPLSPSGEAASRAHHKASKVVTVAKDLMIGMSAEYRRAQGLPDFRGLPATRLENHDELDRWVKSGVPLADGGPGGGGGWVEVHRANAFDRGMFQEMIEEGVETTHNHGHHFKTFWNGKERSYESYTACFHSAVVGSGTFVYVGEAYTAANTKWLTSTPNNSSTAQDARMHGVKSNRDSGVVPTTVLNFRGGSLDVILAGPPCASRKVRLGTCPPAQILRTGWRAQQPCACNESWDHLNCVGLRAP